MPTVKNDAADSCPVSSRRTSPACVGCAICRAGCSLRSTPGLSLTSVVARLPARVAATGSAARAGALCSRGLASRRSRALSSASQRAADPATSATVAAAANDRWTPRDIATAGNVGRGAARDSPARASALAARARRASSGPVKSRDSTSRRSLGQFVARPPIDEIVLHLEQPFVQFVVFEVGRFEGVARALREPAEQVSDEAAGRWEPGSRAIRSWTLANTVTAMVSTQSDIRIQIVTVFAGQATVQTALETLPHAQHTVAKRDGADSERVHEPVSRRDARRLVAGVVAQQMLAAVGRQPAEALIETFERPIIVGRGRLDIAQSAGVFLQRLPLAPLAGAALEADQTRDAEAIGRKIRDVLALADTASDAVQHLVGKIFGRVASLPGEVLDQPRARTGCSARRRRSDRRRTGRHRSNDPLSRSRSARASSP